MILHWIDGTVVGAMCAWAGYVWGHSVGWSQGYRMAYERGMEIGRIEGVTVWLKSLRSASTDEPTSKSPQ